MTERIRDAVEAEAAGHVEIEHERRIELPAGVKHQLLAAGSIAGHALGTGEAPGRWVSWVVVVFEGHVHARIGGSPVLEQELRRVGRVVLVDDHPVVREQPREPLDAGNRRREDGGEVSSQPRDHDPAAGHCRITALAAGGVIHRA